MRLFFYECKKILNIRLILILALFTVLFYYLFMQCMYYPWDNAGSVAQMDLSDRLMKEYGTALRYEDMGVLTEIKAEQTERLDRLVQENATLQKAGITGWEELAEVLANSDEQSGADTVNGVSVDDIWAARSEINFGSGQREVFLRQAVEGVEDDMKYKPFMGVEKGQEEQAAQKIVDSFSGSWDNENEVMAAVRRVEEVIRENRMSLLPDSAFEYVRWDLPRLGLLMVISCMILILPCEIRERLSRVNPICAAASVGRGIWKRRRTAVAACMALVCMVQAGVFLLMLARAGILKYAACPAGGNGRDYLWADMSFGTWLFLSMLLYLFFALGAAALFHLISRLSPNYIVGLAAGISASALFGSLCIAGATDFLYLEYGWSSIWILVCICLGFNILFSLSELEGRDEELRTVYEAFQNGEVSEEFRQQCMSLYDGLDMNNVKEIREEMADYHPSGSYGAFLDQIYDDLNERVEEIRENGEAEQVLGCFTVRSCSWVLQASGSAGCLTGTSGMCLYQQPCWQSQEESSITRLLHLKS